MYWIILANSSLYSIYTYDKKNHQLALLKEEFHPESQLKTSELVSDRPGHYKSRGESRGAYVPHSDPKKNEIDHFLQSLVAFLETSRTNNQFEKIIFIASPQVNGLVSQHLNKHLDALFLNPIKKDYTHFTEQDLNDFLTINWKELTTKNT